MSQSKISLMIEELNRLYDELNHIYFGGELPSAFVTIKQGKTKSASVYGTFTPEAWAKAESVEVDEAGIETVNKSDIHHEIAMSAEYFTRPVPNWVGTLVHEMVHLYCHINDIEDTSNKGRYHNKRFKVEAEKRGLIIDKADVIGWSVTTPSVELITLVEDTLQVNEELFKWFRDTKLGVSDKAKKVRWVCPICGCQAQGKKSLNLVCGDCDKSMDLWDLTYPENYELIEDRNEELSLSDEGWYGAFLNS